MILGLCILIFIIAVLASVWKEGLMLAVVFLLSGYDVHPLIALIIAGALYVILFVGEKIKNGSGTDV